MVLVSALLAGETGARGGGALGLRGQDKLVGADAGLYLCNVCGWSYTVFSCLLLRESYRESGVQALMLLVT